MNTSSNSTGHLNSPATDPFHATHYHYAAYFAVLVPITITSNLLLLATLYKDPLRCFRTPVTYFIVALASVDLVLGLFVEPSFAAYYFTLHRRKVIGKTEPIAELFRIALWTSNACLNISFLQILMLTVSQFIAITFPHSYKTLVTTRRVLLCIALSSMYFVLFTLLQFTGASQADIYKMDLYLHSTAITFLIAVSNAFLFASFRRFNKMSRSVAHNSLRMPERQRQGDTSQEPRQTTRNTTRQFTIITLSLSGLLLFTAVPHIVAMYIKLYNYPSSPAAVSTFKIADRVCGGLMFVKVALDAFIFAWRLPKYRRALRIVVGCSAAGRGPENTLDTLPNASGPREK